MTILSSRFLTLFTLLALLVTPIAAFAQTSTTDNGITILLMGVDEAQNDDAWDEGVRPDSLSVLHLDPDTGSCRLLGIPRDSRVEIPDVGLTKVNHALALGGVQLEESVVEDFLGISIDHYGLIDYDALIGVVDSVGGITVDNPYAFEIGGYSFAEGQVSLDGKQALSFSRYRKGPDGDFGRINRQQLVMRAVLAKLTSANVVTMVPSLLKTVEGNFRTDLTVTEMISLASQFQGSCTPATLETRTLTGENALLPDPLLNQDLWYVVQDPADVDAAVQWLLTGN